MHFTTHYITFPAVERAMNVLARSVSRQRLLRVAKNTQTLWPFQHAMVV
jgi:hypothetical protein